MLRIFSIKNGVRKPSAASTIKPTCRIFTRISKFEHNTTRQPLESSLEALSISTNINTDGMQQKETQLSLRHRKAVGIFKIKPTAGFS
jgi:hypothetical protein